jgi:hypothetical protein
MKKILASLFLVVSGITTTGYAQEPPHFETTTLTAGIYLIKAEIAKTQEQHEYGLMFREKMGTNEGMLFLFSSPIAVCMWMKNTLLPLSVAFMDEKGNIVNIEDMEPRTLNSHCAAKPVYYALEMRQGWFNEKNIKPGTSINGLPTLK